MQQVRGRLEDRLGNTTRFIVMSRRRQDPDPREGPCTTSIVFQVRDVVDAMCEASGTAITDLRVDGGASVMDFMLQLQADQLGVTVRRPVDQETTALGAAYLAGLAEGVWDSVEAIQAGWQLDATFEPTDDRTIADLLHGQWLRAVERSRGWAEG